MLVYGEYKCFVMQMLYVCVLCALFCFVQAKTLCRYGCMYFLTELVLLCVDVMVMSSA